jgi:hypothetical protein
MKQDAYVSTSKDTYRQLSDKDYEFVREQNLQASKLNKNFQMNLIKKYESSGRTIEEALGEAQEKIELNDGGGVWRCKSYFRKLN